MDEYYHHPPGSPGLLVANRENRKDGGLVQFAELWPNTRPLTAKWGRYLTSEDLQSLLRHGSFRFVVTDSGRPLRWIEHSA
jgi:hypothetical protein